MSRRTLTRILLVVLMLSACAPAPTATPTLAPTASPRPSATPFATHTPLPSATPLPTQAPLPSATPTPAAGSMPMPTPSAEGKGYALEFTHQVSSGLATLHAAAHTCSGLRGPWEGTFEVELAYERMHIVGSGTLAFTLPADGHAVQGEAPFTGGGEVSGSSCVILGVSDPLRYEITFSADGRSAQVIMGSTGGGTIGILCPDWPVVTIPFAVAWGPDPLTVPVTAYAACP